MPAAERVRARAGRAADPDQRPAHPSRAARAHAAVPVVHREHLQIPKYLEDHHGLHWLCDYEMSIAPDTTLKRNPQRTTALAQLRAHEQTVAELERQIG